ncbi:hypothetical protein [Robertmurraya sp. P23]|uniref:hypothetical protein n=1 Tax=Robertmurraya sp. P23 TaxID=3436931 RepID=UPI003D9529F4
MKKFKVLLFTILFMLIAVPAMAQSNSPVQKASINGAMFYGGDGTTDTFVNLATDYENKDQYILYLEKYNFQTDEYYYGQAIIPKSSVVFDTKKGTVSVSNTVTLNKVEWVYDKKTKAEYPVETPVGDESINLTWSFNSGDYSYHKTVDKNIEIGFDEYLQLARATYKDYYNVTVSGKIGAIETVDFDYNGGSVFTGTSFVIIK